MLYFQQAKCKNALSVGNIKQDEKLGIISSLAFTVPRKQDSTGRAFQTLLF